MGEDAKEIEESGGGNIKGQEEASGSKEAKETGTKIERRTKQTKEARDKERRNGRGEASGSSKEDEKRYGSMEERKKRVVVHEMGEREEGQLEQLAKKRRK